MKTYIKLNKVGRNYYILTLDYSGHVIDVSYTYKTKKSVMETYNRMLQLDFIEEWRV